MGIIIKNVKITDKSYSFISEEGRETDILKGLSKVNIFVGENNSGKSRFLRSIISDTEIQFIPNHEHFYETIKSIECVKKNMADIINNDVLATEFREIKELFDEIEPSVFLKPNSNIIANLKDLGQKLNTLQKTAASLTVRDINFRESDIHNLLKTYFKCLSQIEIPIEELDFNYNFSKVYIPILRGLRPLNYGDADKNQYRNNFSRDIYEDRTIDDFPELEDNCCIFTGLKVYKYYNDYLHHLNDKKQDILVEYEKFLTKILNQETKITPITNSGVSNLSDIFKIRIGNENGRMIYDLGDGIQSIIIMTFYLFLYISKIKENENLLIFIEEPEHLLHPSLQRKLIETFLDKRFKNCQFFLTTHSNHFLDVAIDYEDVSIYSIDKKINGEDSKFLIKNVSFGNNNLLNLLGVRSSSVFLPNCNIWVEGITDVFYFRRFLELYQRHIKENGDYRKFVEDRHFSYLVYNGDDINNLIDLNIDKDDRRLNRILLIRDGDTRYDTKKNEVNSKLNSILEDNFILLDCWEVENLLSKKTILETLKNDKKCKSINLNDFEYEEYQNHDLGDFIKEKICGNRIDWNPLKKKTKFYKKTEKHIQNFTDLSPEAQKITEKIYDFIEENNI